MTTEIDSGLASTDQLSTVRKYAELFAEMKTLEEQVKELKKQKDDMEPDVLKVFESAGVQSFKFDRLGTVYLHRQLWASAADGDMDRLVQALHAEADTRFLVRETCNSQQLSAWVRELPVDGDSLPVLPAHIKDAIKVTEKFSANVRRG